MEYRRLGRTDLQVSAIGFGGATFGREIDQPTAWMLLDRALERGITLIDTAESYSKRESERMIGEWLRARGTRQQIVLATKCGFTGPLDGPKVTRKIEQSLRMLQTDVIDLFQLHHWPREGDPVDEILEAFSRAVEQGKVRHLGLSNSAAWQLCKALWTQDKNGWARFDSIQPQYNLSDRSLEAEMAPLCQDQGLGILSYSPLGGGFLTGKYSPTGPLPPGTRFDLARDWQDDYFFPRAFSLVERLKAVSRETGRSMVDLALAWALSQPQITSVLIGGRRPGHIDQAFDTLAAGLTPELRDRLDRISDPASFG